ncbi:MAG: M14 family metallopeptidase [Planctomycetota bacterium]
MWHSVALLLFIGLLTGGKVGPELLTVAEQSGFKATALHGEVVSLMDRLAERSPLAVRSSLGETVEGRSIPLLGIADPPIRGAAEARESGKLIVFAFGSIHAGEICGKEALLMLARDLLLFPDRPENRLFLSRCILVIAPVYNADGNDKVKVGQRRHQVGPELGMGSRQNAQDLDLNRDWIKLESPEARAMVRFLTEWDPDLVIDTHTTNGSIHRYTLTFAAPQNPSAHPGPWRFVRDEMLPEVSERLMDRTGHRSFFYGDFDRSMTSWSTYSSQPRFGCPNRGLRNHLSVLSEAYAYASFKERVEGTREFVRECCLFVAESAPRIRSIRELARKETIALGERGGDEVGLRHSIAPFDGKVRVESQLMRQNEEGRSVPSGIPATFLVKHLGRFEPGLTVRRPRAYLVPTGLGDVVEKLRQHGIRVEQIEEARTLTYEVLRVESIRRSERPFQGHSQVTLDTSARVETGPVPSGWFRVPLAQPLGTLALYLLEPESDDSLATWNLLDPWLEESSDYPILREL